MLAALVSGSVVLDMDTIMVITVMGILPIIHQGITIIVFPL